MVWSQQYQWDVCRDFTLALVTFVWYVYHNRGDKHVAGSMQFWTNAWVSMYTSGVTFAVLHVFLSSIFSRSFKCFAICLVLTLISTSVIRFLLSPPFVNLHVDLRVAIPKFLSRDCFKSGNLEAHPDRLCICKLASSFHVISVTNMHKFHWALNGLVR